MLCAVTNFHGSICYVQCSCKLCTEYTTKHSAVQHSALCTCAIVPHTHIHTILLHYDLCIWPRTKVFFIFAAILNGKNGKKKKIWNDRWNALPTKFKRTITTNLHEIFTPFWFDTLKDTLPLWHTILENRERPPNNHSEHYASADRIRLIVILWP